MKKRFSQHLFFSLALASFCLGLVSNLAVLKASTDNFVFKEQEMHTCDLGFSNQDNVNSDELSSEQNRTIKIKDVVIEGNRLVSDDQILKVIKSKAGSIFDREKVLHDLEAISDLGYFVHDSIQANPEPAEGGILIKIRIEEHSPITGVQIIGNKIIDTNALIQVVKDLVGKPENVNKISEAIDTIEKMYQEKGYVLARVKDIALEADGTLTVKIDEGILNNIVIKGNTKTKEKYIKRLISNLEPGEAYNELLLVQDFRSLQNTGFFEDIKREIVPSSDGNEGYDLVVEVKEKRTASFGFGGGVNTVSGAFANLGFNNTNLFGEGKSISLNTQFGTGLLANTFVNQRFLSDQETIQIEARYTDPNFLDTENTISVFTHAYSYNSYLVDLAQERNFGLGASISRKLPFGMNYFGNLDLIGESVQMKDYGVSATNFLTEQILNVRDGKYLGEIVEKNAFKPGQAIDDHVISVKKEIAREVAAKLREKQLEDGKFLHLNPSLTFDTRDNPMSPNSGWYNMVNFGGAVGLGNDSYTKLGIDVRRYVPIGNKVTLAFNVQGSANLIGDIPMYSQFKSGGYYGVRGYRSFSDLGIGTRALFASAEVRTPFLDYFPWLKNNPFAENLRLVFFGDLGYAGGNNTVNRLFNRLTTAASAGIGLRANIPMLGPVRIDYGLPFIKPLWNNKSVLGRFNFGFAERF